jgi:hypothetical protein
MLAVISRQAEKNRINKEKKEKSELRKIKKREKTLIQFFAHF